MFKIIAAAQKIIKKLIVLNPIPINTIKPGKKFIAASVTNKSFDSLFRNERMTIIIMHEFKISHNGIIESSKFR